MKTIGKTVANEKSRTKVKLSFLSAEEKMEDRIALAEDLILESIHDDNEEDNFREDFEGK